MNICYAINNGFEIGFGFVTRKERKGEERGGEDCDLSSIIQSMLACCWISFLSMPIKCLHFAIIFLVCIDLPAEFSELVHLNSIPLEGTSYSRLSDYQNKSVCKITSHTSRVGLEPYVCGTIKRAATKWPKISTLWQGHQSERGREREVGRSIYGPVKVFPFSWDFHKPPLAIKTIFCGQCTRVFEIPKNFWANDLLIVQ